MYSDVLNNVFMIILFFSDMSVSSEVTISPVLLQAISQTLTSKDRNRTTKSVNMKPSIHVRLQHL